jgi:hypothetical protein
MSASDGLLLQETKLAEKASAPESNSVLRCFSFMSKTLIREAALTVPRHDFFS